VLRAGPPPRRSEIPVQLAASAVEVGTLEVHCVAEDGSGQRWQLEFQLRGRKTSRTATSRRGLPPGLDDAIKRIDRIFGSRNQQVETKEVRQLRASLEHLLGGRERWDTPLLRRLFDALMERAKGRRRSAEHERAWLNLAGWCLRPGFGHPLDGWRIEQLWALFDTGVQYHKDSQVRAEWWTLWRRVAGGLEPKRNCACSTTSPSTCRPNPPNAAKRPVTLVDGSEDDMLRLGASLERIPGRLQGEIGDWMLEQIMAMPAYRQAGPEDRRDLRALPVGAGAGRRAPVLHGSAHEVATGEAAERWLDQLLQLDWKKHRAGRLRRRPHRAQDRRPLARHREAVRAEVLRRLAAPAPPPTGRRWCARWWSWTRPTKNACWATPSLRVSN
jgi:hypothetical protein